MKKALTIVLSLALAVGAVWTGACGRAVTLTPEVERGAEKATVETAVRALTQEKGLTDLSKYADGAPTGAPVRSYDAAEATNDMRVFPSTVWYLYPGYTRLPTLEYYYTVENDGTVRQFGDAAKTVEYDSRGFPLPP